MVKSCDESRPPHRRAGPRATGAAGYSGSPVARRLEPQDARPEPTRCGPPERGPCPPGPGTPCCAVTGRPTVPGPGPGRRAAQGSDVARPTSPLRGGRDHRRRPLLSSVAFVRHFHPVAFFRPPHHGWGGVRRADRLRRGCPHCPGRPGCRRTPEAAGLRPGPAGRAGGWRARDPGRQAGPLGSLCSLETSRRCGTRLSSSSGANQRIAGGILAKTGAANPRRNKTAG